MCDLMQAYLLLFLLLIEIYSRYLLQPSLDDAALWIQFCFGKSCPKKSDSKPEAGRDEEDARSNKTEMEINDLDVEPNSTEEAVGGSEGEASPVTVSETPPLLSVVSRLDQVVTEILYGSL